MPYQPLNEDGSRTVLVVDDDPSVRGVIALVLELEGYRVVQAVDGNEAVELARSVPVAMMTLDVMMPGMDGWTVSDTLSADRTTRDIPRLMVSAMPVDKMMRMCADRQVAGVITKPFLPSFLLAEVERIAGPCTGAA